MGNRQCPHQRLGDRRVSSRQDLGIVDVTGEITYASAMDLINLITSWYRPTKSMALIVRLNSPGGSIVASQQLCEYLQVLQANGLKIVVVCGDVVESAALYLAVVADKLIASPSTILGAVGGIITRRELEIAPVLGQWRVDTITSGPLKDSRSNHALENAEGRQMMQEIVEDISDVFCTWLAAHRPLTPTTLKMLRTGRSFTANKALALGLVDSLGGYTAGLLTASDLCNQSNFTRTFLINQTAKPLKDKAWNWVLNNLVKGLLG